MTLLELPSNSINNTQRLSLLRRAFQVQSNRTINSSFVEVTQNCAAVLKMSLSLSLSLLFPLRHISKWLKQGLRRQCLCEYKAISKISSSSCSHLQPSPGGFGRDLLLLLDEVALNLREDVTIYLTDISEQFVCVHYCACCQPSCSAPVLKVQEVFPGANQVVRITVESSSITLPAELFADRKDSGVDPVQ